MDDIPLFAKRLNEARTRAGLSQKQLGIEAGIDPFSASPRINQYERGKHTPDFKTAQRLAGVLDIPTAFFYAEDDEVAELLLLYSSLPQRERRKLVKELRQTASIPGK